MRRRGLLCTRNFGCSHSVEYPVRIYWIIAAGLCGLVAVFFAVRQEYERAFISAVVGSVIWFLGYRSQLKKLIVNDESQENSESDENEET